MIETALDIAHAAMQTDVDDDAARMGFYEKLSGTELFLLLDSEPDGDQIAPKVFELSDNSFVLAFDREDRLAQFTGVTSPYAAMSGRVICQMLTSNALGIGLNLDVAPSSILIPPEAVEWLAGLDLIPTEVSEKIEKLNPPKGLPENFLTHLDARLAATSGLAEQAYLVGVNYRGGATGHLLGFVNALPQAQPSLAKTVAQTLVFTGLDAGTIDVGFFQATDPAVAMLAKCGLRFDLPKSETPALSAPGEDPEKPPILK